MTRLTKNRVRLLEAIRDLRVADLEVLTALLAREPEPGRYTFGAWGVRRACEAFLAEGVVYRLWKHRDPKFKMNRGSARQVFLLAPKGAEMLGGDTKAAERWFTYLKDPRREYVIEHELMIARFHAALVKCGLDGWRQGEGTRIDGRGFRLTPDAFFSVGGRYFFLEADTGNERIESDDPQRRTILGKLRRYALARQDKIPQEQFDIPGFSVIFVVPRESPGRERSFTQAFIGARQHWKVRADFFRLLSESDVMHTLQTGEPLPVFKKRATLEEPVAARPPLPS